jgi:hypothetical protein
VLLAHPDLPRELLAHPDLPRAFKSAQASVPDPVREELTVLVRARKQMVDRHRRLLNEAEALVAELPARLMERLPSGASVAARLAAAARVHLTRDHLTDLRLQLLRLKAQEHRLLVAQCALLERQIANALKQTVSSLPVLGGLGTLSVQLACCLANCNIILIDNGRPRYEFVVTMQTTCSKFDIAQSPVFQRGCQPHSGVMNTRAMPPMAGRMPATFCSHPSAPGPRVRRAISAYSSGIRSMSSMATDPRTMST